MYSNLRFLIPRKTGEVSAGTVLDLYLGGFKGGLGFIHWTPFVDRKWDLIHQNSSGKEYGRKSAF